MATTHQSFDASAHGGFIQSAHGWRGEATSVIQPYLWVMRGTVLECYNSRLERQWATAAEPAGGSFAVGADGRAHFITYGGSTSRWVQYLRAVSSVGVGLGMIENDRVGPDKLYTTGLDADGNRYTQIGTYLCKFSSILKVRETNLAENAFDSIGPFCACSDGTAFAGSRISYPSPLRHRIVKVAPGGSIAWRYEVQGISAIYQLYVGPDGNPVFGDVNGILKIGGGGSGSVLWNYPATYHSLAHVDHSDGSVYCVHSSGGMEHDRLVKLDASGSFQWETSDANLNIGSGYSACVASRDGFVFAIPQAGGSIYKLDASSGSLIDTYSMQLPYTGVMRIETPLPY